MIGPLKAEFFVAGAPIPRLIDPPSFVPHPHLDFALALEFFYLPSWNDLPGDLFSRMSFHEKWRGAGRESAVIWARAAGIKTEAYIHYRKATKKNPNPKTDTRERLAQVLIERPLKIVCRIWRASAAIYDCHNVALKPLLDGFVDARLIGGDSTKWIRSVELVYEGVDRSLELGKDEKKRRRAIQQERKTAGKKPKRMPTRARFRLEFFLFPDETIQPSLLIADFAPSFEVKKQAMANNGGIQ